MSSKLVLSIDCTDWKDGYDGKGRPSVATPGDVATLLEQDGVSTSEVGRHLVVAREEGEEVPTSVPPVKFMLNEGARVAVTGMMTKRYRMVKTSSGRVVKMRTHVATTTGRDRGDDKGKDGEFEHLVEYEGHDEGAPYLRTSDPKAIELARHYLHDVVMGHVYGRLVILDQQGVDIKLEADRLVAALYGKVFEIVGLPAGEGEAASYDIEEERSAVYA